MTTERIFFQEVMRGYDMEQVDKYISKLSEAYQEAYDENTAIRERYNALLDDFKKLGSQEQGEMNPEILLMYAEMLAQKIIADAQAQAAKTKAEAQKVFADTNAMAAQVKAESQKSLSEANAEAAKIVMRARKNIEQAYKIMEQTCSKVQNMLSYNTPDIRIIKAE
ncbi:MAG: DivIVA domain-containing protein [Firmicutes bacterium]|nr:DivIVA domain-containing protein [Bacillota bacterium]